MQNWLKSLILLKNKHYTLPKPASSDASFRRYFRIDLADKSLIIMDAPPVNEDCSAFIKISKQLHKIGLNVPKVIEQNLQQGFLLLTDLGTKTYLSVLNQNNVEHLYSQALTSLVTLQVEGKKLTNTLPVYTNNILQTEMALFNDWLGQNHLNMSMNKLERSQWQQVQNTLINSAIKQPQAYVHRDYHSRNLMFTEQNNPGILDYQDALHGPLTYDAASMLKDCYITWDEQQVDEWLREYFLMLDSSNIVRKHDWKSFQQSFHLMGIQRHLKAAGIFARLYHRDGKEGYLQDIPATLNYIIKEAKKHKEMAFLANWVEQVLFKLDTT